MPRVLNAFFNSGLATYSVVPGGTVVSINTRQWGDIFSPIFLKLVSSALMSAYPLLRLPSSCLRKSHWTSTTRTSASFRASYVKVAVIVCFLFTHRSIIGATSGSSAFMGDMPRLKSGIFQKLRVLGLCMPITYLADLPVFLSTESATTPAITAPTKPRPMTTTISKPSSLRAVTSFSSLSYSRA